MKCLIDFLVYITNIAARRTKASFALTLKPGENLFSRKSIKIIINGNEFKKRNSEFLPYKKFAKKNQDDIPLNQEKISILGNKDFFNVIKMDPRLDEYI